MQQYEQLGYERYRNIKRALNTLTVFVFIFGLLIISITVAVKYIHHDSSSPIHRVYNYSGYDPDRSLFTVPMFEDRCLHMRPLLREECEMYYISENSTWRNDDDGMCSQYFLKPGDICEGDGECDTNDNLNNCGDGLDIYLITPLRERP
jgi:hypothetical protein